MTVLIELTDKKMDYRGLNMSAHVVIKYKYKFLIKFRNNNHVTKRIIFLLIFLVLLTKSSFASSSTDDTPINAPGINETTQVDAPANATPVTSSQILALQSQIWVHESKIRDHQIHLITSSAL